MNDGRYVHHGLYLATQCRVVKYILRQQHESPVSNYPHSLSFQHSFPESQGVFILCTDFSLLAVLQQFATQLLFSTRYSWTNLRLWRAQQGVLSHHRVNDVWLLVKADP